jgi:RNA-binding protein
VLEEIDAALKHHELLKFRMSSTDRCERQQQLALICDNSSAQSIQQIGKVGVVYRRGEPPRIDLS